MVCVCVVVGVCVWVGGGGGRGGGGGGGGGEGGGGGGGGGGGWGGGGGRGEVGSQVIAHSPLMNPPPRVPNTHCIMGCHMPQTVPRSIDQSRTSPLKLLNGPGTAAGGQRVTWFILPGCCWGLRTERSGFLPPLLPFFLPSSRCEDRYTVWQRKGPDSL